MIEVPRASEPAGSGLLLVDKPAAATSHDVVAAVRRLAGTRKVGHAGTLDPMATGLLVLGVGAGTKLLTYLAGLDKDYEATMRFGIGTDTDDADGTVTATPGLSATDHDIDRALAGLLGDIDQVPSTFSAKKIGGKRAYDLARGGRDVDLAPVRVTVRSLERTSDPGSTVVDGIPVTDVEVSVTVSTGTYIRALARDAGASINSAAHLRALRRTRVGSFRVADAMTIEEAVAAIDRGPLPLVSMAEGAGAVLNTIEVSAAEERALRYGQVIERRDTSGPVALVRDGSLVAIGVPRGGGIGPATVFPASA